MSSGARQALLWLALVLVLFPLAISKPGLPTSLKSDEPAYYLAALSLARDGDLRFEPGEAERLFDEFPFLTVKNLILMTEDGWRTVYYGKPYIYSLFAAPFAGLFGANGMVSFNMLLLMAMIWMGASYLRRYNPDALAVAFSAGFFILSSTFAYVFWMHPELFNMACVTGSLYLAFTPADRAAGLFGANGMVSFNMLLLMAMIWMGASYLRRYNPDALAVAFSAGFFILSSTFAYVFWMHPELFNMACVTGSLYLAFTPADRAAGAMGGRWRRWFGEAARPFWSAACLAPAVYNKPMLALMALAPAWIFLRRLRWRGVVRFAAGALIAGGLVAGISLALTGKPSAYLGVNRRGWNVPTSDFMPPVVPLESKAQAINAGSWWWILDAPTAKAGETVENMGYFLVGRHTGLFVYGPFALVSLLLFLVHRRRSRERWVLLASLAGVALVFLLWIPFNWHGGGGFVGNRYYINVYPGFLFLAARLAPTWLTGLGYAAGALLTGGLLFTPFGAPVHRPTLQAHVRHAPFALFPFEFTIRDQIPGYEGGSQLGRWFLGRADQLQVHGDELWLLGNSRVRLWLFSYHPLTEPVFRIRSLAPGNRVRLGLPGDEAEARFGDEPAAQTVTLRPSGPTRVRHERGREVLVYDLTVESDRGWSTRQFHLGAALVFVGEKQRLERPIWDVEWLECTFPAAVEVGEEPFSGVVRLRNASGENWLTGPGGRVKLAYHWLDEGGEPVVFEGARTPFPELVKRGGEVELSQQVLPPEAPGSYRLQVDLVYEFVGWFSERGAPTCEAEVEVLPPGGAASRSQSAK